MTPDVTNETEPVVTILTEAFTGDPVMSWLFPGVAAHVAALDAWWGFITSNAPPGAECWLADDGSSAALWYPPDFEGPGSDSGADAKTGDHEPPHGSESDDQPGTDEPNPFIAMVGGLVGDRLGEVLELFGRIMAAHPVEPHWYLAAVGTRPASQGRGSGAALLAPVLERCDAEGLPAYLESSNPRNLAFYHRLGFEVTGEIHTLDRTAHLTAMWRNAR